MQKQQVGWHSNVSLLAILYCDVLENIVINVNYPLKNSCQILDKGI